MILKINFSKSYNYHKDLLIHNKKIYLTVNTQQNLKKKLNKKVNII